MCCSPDEEEYFLEMMARISPDIQVRSDETIFCFYSVRPLAFTNARIAGQITHDHHFQEDKIGEMPVYSLVGGKWTSFRAFAEQVTDWVLNFLGQSRNACAEALPIGDGKDHPCSGNVKVQFSNRVARDG